MKAYRKTVRTRNRWQAREQRAKRLAVKRLKPFQILSRKHQLRGKTGLPNLSQHVPGVGGTS
jgi:hypothetical protein